MRHIKYLLAVFLGTSSIAQILSKEKHWHHKDLKEDGVMECVLKVDASS